MQMNIESSKKSKTYIISPVTLYSKPITFLGPVFNLHGHPMDQSQYTAVFSVVTQRSFPNGCVTDYLWICFSKYLFFRRGQIFAGLETWKKYYYVLGTNKFFPAISQNA